MITDSLRAALETLLPGDGRFPGAAAIDLVDRMSGIDHLHPAVAIASKHLPADMADRSASERTRLLQAWETDDPEGFGGFVIAAYSAYYTHPTVLAAIEAATGYAARPPQPAGYALAPFDDAVVAVPRRHGKRWRDT